LRGPHPIINGIAQQLDNTRSTGPLVPNMAKNSVCFSIPPAFMFAIAYLVPQNDQSLASSGAKSSDKGKPKYSKPWSAAEDFCVLQANNKDSIWATASLITGHPVEECKRRYEELTTAPITPAAAPAQPTSAPTPALPTSRPAATTEPSVTWNHAQDDFILAHAGKASWDTIAAIMGRSAAAVSTRWCQLQATLQPPPPPPAATTMPHGIIFAGHGTYGQAQPAQPAAAPLPAMIIAVPASAPPPPGAVPVHAPAQPAHGPIPATLIAVPPGAPVPPGAIPVHGPPPAPAHHPALLPPAVIVPAAANTAAPAAAPAFFPGMPALWPRQA